jgi:hypothetical protein
MPKLLTTGQKSPKDEMKALIDEVKPPTLRQRLMGVLAKL